MSPALDPSANGHPHHPQDQPHRNAQESPVSSETQQLPDQQTAQQQQHPNQQAPAAHHDMPEPRKPSRAGLVVVVLLVLIVAAVLAGLGILHRRRSTHELTQYTDTTAAPPVALEQPVLQQTAQEIVLPGNMQAYAVAPIYARTTGYVKAWYHDIGSHVRKGELLAVIETPELDQQLAAAQADLQTAQSNAGLAKVTADRYKDLIGRNAVSQQDTDNAATQLEARNTQVASAQANVRRLQELVSFERIEAPFDGVVTARNLDVGQLISPAGSTNSTVGTTMSGNKEIFDISSLGRLRVFVNVPQIYAPDARTGVLASLTLPQYAGRNFTGKLVRSSDSVDPNTRTLLAEVDVDNRSGDLLPGSYTEVHLHVKNSAPALLVPVSALILAPDGLRIATVDSSHHIRMLRVTPGRDFGTTVEILAGLQVGQPIVGNPSDSITDGEEVRVVNPDAGTKPAQVAQAR